MGYIPVEKLRNSSFFSVRYTPMPAGERLGDLRKMCGGKSIFSVAFDEDKQGNIYVDVNPRDKDGYEYQVVNRMNLLVWTVDGWEPFGCNNFVYYKIRDDGGGSDTVDFYDDIFRLCVFRTIGGMLGVPLAMGVFFEVFDKSFQSCVAE